MAVVYTVAHLSLAVLEMLVQDQRQRAAYVAIPAQIPDNVAIKHLAVAQLPNDWRELSGVEALRTLGGSWLAQKESAVLAVPSAVLPQELIYLLSPTDSDFSASQLVRQSSSKFDSLFPIIGTIAAAIGENVRRATSASAASRHLIA